MDFTSERLIPNRLNDTKWLGTISLERFPFDRVG
jgi:hypothetical protein